MIHARTHSLSLIVFSAIAYLGCGRVEAERQEDKKLPKVDFQIVEQGFFLTEGSFDKTFDGTTLMWAQDPSIDGMASVAKISSALIRNGVKQLQYIDDKIRPLGDDFDQTYHQLVAAKGKSFALVYPAMLYAAGTWLAGADGKSGRLGELARALAVDFSEPLSDVELGLANENIAMYCEAKIWERAVFAGLVEAHYRARRPTPAALCEGYYERAGLLNTNSKECSAQPNVYRNYFTCLWQQGVLKTNLWQQRYPVGSIVNDTLQNLDQLSLRELFGKRRQGSKLLRQEGKLLIPASGTGEVISLDLSYNSQGQGLGGQSVARIIGNFENPTDESDALFARQGRSNAAQEFLNKWQDALLADLSFFSKLDSQHAINEAVFNLPLQEVAINVAAIRWDNELATQAQQRFPSIVGISVPAAAPFEQKSQELIQRLMQIAASVQILGAELTSGPHCASSSARTLGCNAAELADESQQVLGRADVGQAIWQSKIRIYKSPDEQLLFSEVKVNYTATKVSRACAALVKDPSVKCPKQTKQGEEFDGVLTFNSDTGAITIRVPIAKPLDYGMMPLPRSEFARSFVFNELRPAQLTGVDLVYTAALSLVDKVLLTLIGDVRLEYRAEASSSLKAPHIHAYGAIKLKDQAPEQKLFLNAFVDKLKQLAQ